jgi:hypothetical protein
MRCSDVDSTDRDSARDTNPFAHWNSERNADPDADAVSLAVAVAR